MTAGGNASKQPVTSNMVSSTDTLGADHEYHEISDEENQESPKAEKYEFDFGPSLMAEMAQVFGSFGKSTELEDIVCTLRFTYRTYNMCDPFLS